jgi:excisionase family DNA binding protein
MDLKDRLRINPAEMAGLLGISKRTLSDWMRRRLIPFERIGPSRGRSIVMFDIAAVDAALKRWRIKAVGSLKD